MNIVIPTVLHSLHSLSQTNENTWKIECKGKNSKIFHTEVRKTNDWARKKNRNWKKENTVGLYVSLSPYKQKKNYMKLLPYLQSKKVIEKDLNLTISEKILKIWKKWNYCTQTNNTDYSKCTHWYDKNGLA